MTSHCVLKMATLPCTRMTQALQTVSEDITRNFIPDIKNVMDWLKANNLSLNVMKTECILTGTRSGLELSPLMPGTQSEIDIL